MSSLNYVGHRFNLWFYDAKTGRRQDAQDQNMPPPTRSPYRGTVIHAVCITDHTQPDFWVGTSGRIPVPIWWLEEDDGEES